MTPAGFCMACSAALHEAQADLFMASLKVTASFLSTNAQTMYTMESRDAILLCAPDLWVLADMCMPQYAKPQTSCNDLVWSYRRAIGGNS